MRAYFYIYGIMSFVTLIVYAIDKHAAICGKWRISEKTLHLLELACGWPGALIAQRLFHHKCSKASYQFGFWVMVILNLAAVWWLKAKVAAFFA